MEFLGQVVVFILFILLAAVVAYGPRNSFMRGHGDPTARRGRQGSDDDAPDAANARAG
jgi:hypothetical protein